MRGSGGNLTPSRGSARRVRAVCLLTFALCAVGLAVAPQAGAQVSSTPSYFVPVAPQARMLDTRLGIGAPAGAVPHDTTVSVQISGGSSGVPSGAVAVVFNLTVAEPTGAGYVSARPDLATTQRLSSSINFAAGQTIANLVTTQLGANGRLALYNYGGSAHLIVDVQGYYTTTQSTGVPGGWFRNEGPTRVLDTRTTVAIGPGATLGTAIGNGATYAAMVNVTVTEPTAAGYLTVYGGASAQPTASTINFAPGQTIANQVVVDSSSAMIFNGSAGTVHVVMDVTGIFGAFAPGTDPGAGWSRFHPLDPSRLTDTRMYGAVVPGGTISTTVGGRRPAAFTVPNHIVAAVINVAATEPAGLGYASLLPFTAPLPPGTSTLNLTPGITIAGGGIVNAENEATTPAGSLSAVTMFNGTSGSVHFVLDLVGYFD